MDTRFSLFRTALVLALLATAGAQAQAQVTWTGEGDGASWQDAANWSTERVPDAGDAVVLPAQALSYTVVLDETGGALSLDVQSGASLVVAGELFVEDVLSVTGTVTGNGALEVGGGLELADGFLATATIDVFGPVLWTGGDLAGSFGEAESRVATFRGGGTFAPPPASSFRNQAEVVVRARTLRLEGSAPFEVTNGYIGMDQGAVVVVAPGAELRFTGDDESGVRPNFDQFVRSTLVNDGRIVKAGGAGLFDETWLGGRSVSFSSGRDDYVDVSGEGTFRADVGTLALNLTNASTALAGTYQAGDGARVRLSPVDPTADSVFVVSGATRGAGSVELNGPMRHVGTHDVTGFTSTSANNFSGLSVVFADTMNLVSLGALSVFGGTGRIEPAGTYALSRLSVGSGATLILTPDVVVSGETSLGSEAALRGAGGVDTQDFLWRNATLGQGGPFVVRDSLTVAPDFEYEGGRYARLLQRRLEANGVTVWDNGDLILDQSAILAIGPAGDFQVGADALFLLGPEPGSARIENGGAFRKVGAGPFEGGFGQQPPGVFFETRVAAPFEGGGQVEAGAGRLAFADRFDVSGTVQGTDTLDLASADVAGAFTLAPGTAGTTGTLTLIGPYDAAGRTLAVDVGADASDLLRSDAAVTLGGTLRARLAGGALPSGTRRTVVEAASVAGAFDALDLPPGFAVETTPTQVVLVAGAAVPNRPPVAQDDAAETDEDVPTFVGVTANDTDPDEDDLTLVEITEPARSGTAVIDDNGVVYTPNPDFFGQDTLRYRVSDGELSDEAQLVLTVRPVADAPVAADDAAQAPFETPIFVDVLANDTDVDGDGLEVAEIVITPDAGTATLDGNQIRYAPAPGFSGEAAFTYAVTDGALRDTAQVVVTVSAPGNRAPVAAADADTLDEDTSTFVGVLRNDTDPDEDALEVAEIVQAPVSGAAVIDDNGVVYTPAADFFGSDTLAYAVTDGALRDTAQVVLTVRPVADVPVAADDVAQTAFETPVLVDVLANDTDVDGDGLEVAEIVQAPTSGTAVIDDSGIVYTPAAGFGGTDTLTYAVTDGALRDTAQVVVTVSAPGNRAPTAQDDTAALDEDTSTFVSVLANDTDVNEDALEVAEITAAPTSGAAVIDDNGVVYTPAADFFGSDTLAYAVTDGALRDTAQVVLTVRPINDAPTAADDATQTAFNTAVFVSVLVNDTDVDEDALEVAEIVQAPVSGAAVIDDNGVVYTPDPNFFGQDTLTYAVTDGALRDTAQVVVTVSAPGNRAPAAAADADTLDEDTSTFVDVLRNDTDPDEDDLALVEITEPARSGAAVIDDNGVVYTPDPNFFGQDTLRYRVSDGELSDEAQLVLTVRPVNDAPTAADDAASTEAGVPVLIDVLANDTDADGDALALVLVGTPAGGVVETADGRLRYTPRADFSGLDRFAYAATDGALRDTAFVSVTVRPANRAPVAAADTFLVNPRPSTLDVLANDADPDGDALRLVGVRPSDVGAAVTVASDSSVLYVPPPGFDGDDAFVYVVADPAGLRDSARVVVRVRPLRFAVTDLGTLGGPASRALAVSDDGTVVGAALDAGGSVQAFVWSQGQMRRLTPPAGLTQATAYARNADGVTAGFGADDEAAFAVRMDADAAVLDGLGGRSAAGYAVASNGAVAGAALGLDGAPVAVVWPAGSDAPVPLAIASSAVSSEAFGLSDAGVAVGALVLPDGTSRAFRGPDVLEASARAYAVNEAGVTVGGLREGDAVRPVRWDAQGGAAQTLGTLGGTFGEAYALNDAGWIVGASTVAAAGKASAPPSWPARPDLSDRWASADVLTSSVGKRAADPDLRAFLFLDGTLRDLNALVPPAAGWTLAEARGVTESGQIVGWGLLKGQTRAFLLTPTGNTPPAVAADRAASLDRAPVTIDVLANDADRDADSLFVASLVAPGGGSARVAPDGRVVYTPDPAFWGRDAFAYVVSDGRGGLARGQVEVEVAPPVPSALTLEAPRPNPARGAALVTYALPRPADVRLTLFDVQGRRVRVLDAGARAAGPHEVRVDLGGLAAGIYWCRLVAGGEAATTRALVVAH